MKQNIHDEQVVLSQIGKLRQLITLKPEFVGGKNGRRLRLTVRRRPGAFYGYPVQVRLVK